MLNIAFKGSYIVTDPLDKECHKLVTFYREVCLDTMTKKSSVSKEKREKTRRAALLKQQQSQKQKLLTSSSPFTAFAPAGSSASKLFKQPGASSLHKNSQPFIPKPNGAKSSTSEFLFSSTAVPSQSGSQG